MSDTMRVEYFDDEGCEVVADLPARYEVCGGCGGHGVHVDPSIDGRGLSAEDFAEDPDFEEAYFAGAYDVQCSECRGQRVVLVPAHDLFTEEHRRHWDGYQCGLRASREVDLMYAAERRMGA